MASPKNVTIEFCRESGCPVQKSIDNHINQGGNPSEIKLIKDAHCVRCPVYKIRKWMEREGYTINKKDSL